MSIKDKYSVQEIPKEETHQWILKKHYAHRIPSITYSYGLYDNKTLNGVLTIGTPPCRFYNDGIGVFDNYKVDTKELNRLCINDNLEKNVLSYFVSQVLKLLPRPMCIVSFADANANHHGYIYQATNWIYTGIGGASKSFYNHTLNKEMHMRHYGEYIKRGDECEIIDLEGKYRYFMFLGNRKEVREMKKKLKYKILHYPKGDNKRYDTSYEPNTQGILF